MDVPALGQRVAQLEGQMQDQAGTLGEVKRAIDDLRADIKADTRDLRAEMRDLRSEIDRRFGRVDQKIDRQFTWLVGILVGVLLALVGLGFQIVRLQPL